MEWCHIQSTPTMKSWNWLRKENGWLNLKHVQVRKPFLLFPTNNFTDEVYQLWTRCWSIEPMDRPSFAEILDLLNRIQGQQSSEGNSFASVQQEFDQAFYLTTAAQRKD